MIINLVFGVISGLFSLFISGGNVISFIIAFILTFVGCCFIDILTQRQIDKIKKEQDGKNI